MPSVMRTVVIDEFRSTRREMVSAYLKVLPSIYLEGLRKTSKN